MIKGEAMERKAVFCMAFGNIVMMKKHFIVIISSYIVIAVTIICFGAYRHAIGNETEKIVRTQASNCVLFSNKPIKEKYYSQISSRINRYDWPSERTPKGLDLVCNGKVYKGNDLKNNFFTNNANMFEDETAHSVSFGITAVLPEDDCVFPDGQIIEMTERTKSDSPLKYGSFELQAGEVLITDFMLQQFGISEQEQKELVGRRITIKDESNGIIYIDNLELLGVINSDIFYTKFLSENPLTNASLSQVIIVYNDCPDVMKTDMANQQKCDLIINEGVNDSIEKYPFSGTKICGCYIRSFSDFKILADNLKHDGYDITFSDSLEMYYGISQQNVVVDSVVSIILVVLVVSLLLFIVTALYFYHLRQFKYRQMLRAIGMKVKDVFLISIAELMICVVLSMSIAFVLSLVLIVLFNLYLSNELYVTVDMNLLEIFELLLLSFLSLAFFSICASVVSLLNLNKTPLPVSLNAE